jgi:Pathogenicity locus
MTREDVKKLEDLPNVGPATAADFRLLGISKPEQLIGKDPFQLYEKLCQRTGVQHNPCVIDVFIATTRFMGGEPAKPWWKYTAERKRLLTAGDAERTTTPARSAGAGRRKR